LDFAKKFKKELFDTDESNFEKRALQLFAYQALNNSVYKEFIAYLGINVEAITRVNDIPFLPIEFFKTHTIKTGNWESRVVFESSGTTGSVNSKHHILDIEFYNKVCQHIFEDFFGSVSEYCILGLLPSYLERNNSSLVHMVSQFIKISEKSGAGFFLNNFDLLLASIKSALERKEKVLLIGVTFALLDFAESQKIDLSSAIVMETGGMKGRRAEMVREEVHLVLKKKFSLTQIHSEYGMTELLSQAYSLGEGLFKCPKWMKIIVRDINDPFDKGWQNKRGGINVVDLANVDSCAFIETKDLGIVEDSGFRVLGRFDNSDLRGCSLLVI